MKKIFSFFSALLVLWGIVYGYIHITDGFSIREMTSSLSEDLSIAAPPLTVEKKSALQYLLDQKFHYIGKGCQFYAFESDDGEYVLKFFKHKHLRPLTWLRSLPMTAGLRARCEERIEQREKRVARLFSSCQLAYDELSFETGVVYLHLNRKPALEKEITLIDRLGFKHQIALDDFEFVLQKRAVGVERAFSDLLKDHREKEIREKIQQLIKLVEMRCEKGIRDRDRSFVQNVAFSQREERALFVDIGQFFKDESITSEEEMQKDLIKRLANLRYWTERHLPSLTPYVDEALSKY